jgi:hypothetical protein
MNQIVSFLACFFWNCLAFGMSLSNPSQQGTKAIIKVWSPKFFLSIDTCIVFFCFSQSHVLLWLWVWMWFHQMNLIDVLIFLWYHDHGMEWIVNVSFHEFQFKHESFKNFVKKVQAIIIYSQVSITSPTPPHLLPSHPSSCVYHNLKSKCHTKTCI